MKTRTLSYAFTWCVFVLLAGLSAMAQTDQGTLAGTIYDSSGALLANAKIAAKNSQSGTSYQSTSNDSGLYRFPQMAIGSYTVTVTVAGFKTATYSQVQITVAGVTPLNAHLEIGTATENVTVNADGLHLETESSDISGVITARQIQDLPLTLGGMKGTRAPEAFTYLLPGTVAYGVTNNGIGGNPSPGFLSKISGSQSFASQILLDGADTYRSENGSTFDETSPSVDAIQEFRVELSSPSAEYGRTTGGIEVFSTKSGTNKFHGGAYDFFRNTDLDANSWFNNLNGVARPTDQKNDFGFFVGGPVRIPKVYNGRDKTFFFFSWEKFDQHQGATNQAKLPTNTGGLTGGGELNGDFSNLLGSATTTINPCTGMPIITGQIFDPQTEMTVQTANGPQTCRSPFPNNIIDPTRFSAVAKNVIKQFGASGLSPNFTGGGQGGANYLLSSTGLNLNTLYSIRIDQNAGTKNKFYFTYHSRKNSPAVNFSFPAPFDTNSPQIFSTHFYRFGWDYTISPALLNNFVIGYNRTNSHNAAAEATGTTDWDQVLGIGGTPPATTFPQFAFDGRDNISNLGQNTNNDVIDNGYRVNESLDWLHGKNNFRFGGQYYLQLFDPLSNSGESGSFNFSRNQTSGIVNNTGVTGNSFASFLLGQVDYSNLTDHSIQFKEISHYYNLFVEDDWKILPNLTLNLGMSYSVDTPYRYANGNTSNIDLNTPNPGAGGLPGALVFAGNGTGRNGNVNETWANTWRKDFAPRVGFAYSPGWLNSKTVIRGYYGIFYAPMTHGDFNVQNVDGFIANPSKSSNGFDEAFNIDGGFPAYAPPPNLDPSQDNFTGPVVILPSFGRPGMVQNFSLQVQQELAPDLIFTLGYVGNRSEHLKSGFNFYNSIPKSDFVYGAQLGQPVSSLPGVTLPWASFPTGQNFSQTLRPHPQYFSFGTGTALENLGAGDFDALEATLQRRFRSGLTLLASYTFSKTLTDSETAIPFFAVGGGAGAQDPTNLKYDKSISTQDLPSNFVLSYLYELPVGKGKKFLGNSNRAVDTVLGGWQIGGVQRYESGQAITWGGATGVPNYDASIHFIKNPTVPILSSAWKSGHFNPILDRMFDSHAFLDPNAQHDNLPDPVAARGGAYAFGNYERVTGNIRTHYYLDEDFSLNKRFPLIESTDLLLQTTILNAFNRHDFGVPDTNPYGGSECQPISPTNPSPNGCSQLYTFGQITQSIVGARSIQLSLRFEF
jgi:hypothetical protein